VGVAAAAAADDDADEEALLLPRSLAQLNLIPQFPFLGFAPSLSFDDLQLSFGLLLTFVSSSDSWHNLQTRERRANAAIVRRRLQ
jgi:hypothetical protein